MRLLVFCVFAFIASILPLHAEEAVVRAADGFQLPVGPSGTGAGYYVARGFRPNGHLGEDWNGVGGGDTDLGDPVYAAAHGIVVFARNYHVGWGNVVIIRHAYYDGSDLKYCDSLYGHLLDFTVHEGEQVHRGQQIGRIGNNFGMYEAHLHFEMRKNLQIGMYRSSFPRDFSNYYTPTEFITAHHICPKGNHMVNVPIDTFPSVPPPILVGPHVETPVVSVPPPGSAGRLAKISPLPQNASPSVPVFRTSKTYASVSAPPAPAPTPTPEPASKKKELAAAPPATPDPTASKKHSKEAATEAIATASPTPAPTSKHGKKIAAAATPEPKPIAKSGEAASESPTIKLADDSGADESAQVVTSSTPASSKHSKKLASATGSASPKILQFQPVAGTDSASPKVATTDPSEKPIAAPSPSPSAKSSHSKKVAATATPKPAPKKTESSQELTADAMALPISAPAQAGSAPGVASAAKKAGDTVALIPEPIASAPNPASNPAPNPAPVHRVRRSSATPAPGSGFVIVNGTQVVAPQPILPAPSADAAPVRQSGSSYKIDRYEDLRGGKGY